MLINKFLIKLLEQWDWQQKFPSVQPRLVIGQQSTVLIPTVARSRSLTSKFMHTIMPVVEKDGKVLMEELREFRGYTFFSKQSIIAPV